MTQATVDLYKQYVKSITKKRSIAIQTGDDNEHEFYLADKKIVKLYFSPVYKERVISFNLSSSKSFIMNKAVWYQFRKLVNTIDSYFNESTI